MNNFSGATKVNFGIIGIGEHSLRVLIPAFSDCHHAGLCALASTNSDTRKHLETSYPHLRIYSRYEDLLSDENVNVVFVALPNHLHAAWACHSLEAGKHVLVEKPFALTAEEAHAVHERTERFGKRAAEAFMYRFHPQHQKVKELLRENAIGELRMMESHYHYSLADPRNIRLRKECGGGGLNDVGCYLIDLARFMLASEPRTISGSWQLSSSGIDEFAAFQMVFPNDVVVNMTCGCNLPRANNYSLLGTTGKISVPTAFKIPRNKKGLIEIRDRNNKLSIIETDPVNQTALMLDGFAASVRDAPCDKGLISDGLHNAQILEIARAAALSGELQDINVI